MTTLTLISHPLCPYVQRVAITLHEKNIAFTRINIDLANKPDWFLRISPLGKTPVLLVDETPIFESTVICEYLEDSYQPILHPVNPLLRALHRSWMEFGSSLLNAIGNFYSAPNKTSMIDAAKVIKEKLRHIEEQLSDGIYFEGSKFSLVDAVFGPIFRYFDAFDQLGDFGFYNGLIKVPRWRKALSKRTSVQQVVDKDYNDQLLFFIETRGHALSDLVKLMLEKPASDKKLLCSVNNI